MKRRTARENAILAAFEATFAANSLEEIIAASRENGEFAVDAYGEALLSNYYAHSAEVDGLIESHLRDWTLARLPRVSAAILRISVTEMLYSAEDMDSIVINEAVEISKKYGADSDYQFVNGVLGAVARERAAKAAAGAAPSVPDADLGQAAGEAAGQVAIEDSAEAQAAAASNTANASDAGVEAPLVALGEAVPEAAAEECAAAPKITPETDIEAPQKEAAEVS